MEIYFKNIHEAITQLLIDRAETRLKKLERFIDETKLEAHAYVEINKATAAHNSGDIWKASINLDVAGTRYHAEAVSDHPEKATNRAINEMKIELRRAHARDKMLRRRQHSVWKTFSNFGLS